MRDEPALVDRVVAAFAALALPAEGSSPAELGELARIRDLFLAAGNAEVRRATASESWLQVGLAFADEAQERRFRADLVDPVGQWLADGRLSDFFFMSKPPGMRLRFATSPGVDLEPDVVALLERARRSGDLERVEFGLYDQETHQFGGAAGIRIFHRFSTADCLAVLRFDALEAAGRASVDRSVLSLLAVTDLVSRVADDTWEQWDVWCEMRATGRLVEPDSDVATALREDLEQNRPLLEAVLERRPELVAELTDEERALVDAYAAVNQATADALREAARARTLAAPPRKILPFFVIFHWNRMGLEIDDQLALTFFLYELLNPRR